MLLTCAFAINPKSDVTVNKDVNANLYEKADASVGFGKSSNALSLGVKAQNEAAPVAAGLASDVVGKQISEKDAEGRRSIRFIAAITDLNMTASVTRTLVNEAGESVVASNTLGITTAYTSVVNGDDIAYPSSFGEEYNYFVVYTMANVPESHWFSVFSVTFNFNAIGSDAADSVSEQANIEGLMPLDENLEYIDLATADSTTAGYTHPSTPITTGYGVKSKTSASSYVVPNYYKTFEGSVATKVAPVTSLVNKAASTGCFEGTGATSITLGDNLVSLGKSYAFYNLTLSELVLPRGLTSLGSSTFNNSTIGTLYYNCVNATVAPSMNKVSKIVIATDVTVLPASMFNTVISTTKLVEINYGGTEAQYASLVEPLSATSSMKVCEYVICSDTTISTVTFHLNGGSLNGSTEDITVNVITGKTVKQPDRPEHDLMFNGWYADAAYSVEFDFSAPIIANTDIYAQFVDFPAGTSEDNPLIMNTFNYDASLTTTAQVQVFYHQLTVVTADRYWFSLESYDITSRTGYSYNPTSQIYVYINGVKKATISGTNRTDFELAVGDVVVLKISSHDIESNPTYTAEGTITYKVYTLDHDTKAEAVAMTLNQNIVIDNLGRYDIRILKFVAPESKSYKFTVQNAGSVWYQATLTDGIDTTLATLRGINPLTNVVEFIQGETYYIEVSTNTNFVAEEKELSLIFADIVAGDAPTAPLSLDLDQTTTAVFDSLSTKYYQLVITEETIYRFDLSTEATSTATIAITKDSTAVETFTGTNTIKGFATLAAGTYQVACSLSSTTNMKDCVIKVSKAVAGATFDNAIALDPTNIPTINLVANDTAHYVFTAPEGKQYTFSTSATVTLNIYSNKGTTSVASLTNGEAKFDAVGGNTYYMTITATADVSITLSCEIVDYVMDGTSFAKAINLGELSAEGWSYVMDATDGKSSRSTYTYYKFTVSESGTYRFYSTNEISGDTQGSLYQIDTTTRIGHNDDRSTSTYPDSETLCGYRYDFYFEVDLVAGETYYFGFGASQKASGTYTFVIAKK